ncbi:unnamed protein product, partial [Iphiclides podalirius]
MATDDARVQNGRLTFISSFTPNTLTTPESHKIQQKQHGRSRTATRPHSAVVTCKLNFAVDGGRLLGVNTDPAEPTAAIGRCTSFGAEPEASRDTVVLAYVKLHSRANGTARVDNDWDLGAAAAEEQSARLSPVSMTLDRL